MKDDELPTCSTTVMDPAHFHELAELEASYWWHVAKRELIVELLTRYAPPPARLLEAGTGTGGNFAAFRELGYDVLGFDVSPEAVSRCHHRGLRDVVQHDVNQPWPFEAESRDVVVLLDVMEHCLHVANVWRNVKHALRPDGLVILNVPAIPWLYGPWDKALGHYRRYTARRLRNEAAEAGMSEIWLSYWNAFSLPPAITVRTLQKLSGRVRPATFPRVPRLLNRLLITTARIERSVMRRWSLPCGLSVAGVFRR
jgi:SAM-dependent methyltransferase